MLPWISSRCMPFALSIGTYSEVTFAASAALCKAANHRISRGRGASDDDGRPLRER